MAGFASYSTTPASNTSVGGINIAENCPAANINNALRAIMADAAAEHAALPDVTTLVPKSGAVFTTNPTLTSSGGYLHNANAAQIGGTVSVLPTGTALPASPAEGDFVFFY